MDKQSETRVVGVRYFKVQLKTRSNGVLDALIVAAHHIEITSRGDLALFKNADRPTRYDRVEADGAVACGSWLSFVEIEPPAAVVSPLDAPVDVAADAGGP